MAEEAKTVSFGQTTIPDGPLEIFGPDFGLGWPVWLFPFRFCFVWPSRSKLPDYISRNSCEQIASYVF